LVYYIVVPAGATSLKVVLAANNGDADIFVKAGKPTNLAVDGTSAWACFSAGGTSNESCTVTNPQQRIYYVTIDAYVGYTNATLTATLTP
jgi:xanthomonalisin